MDVGVEVGALCPEQGGGMRMTTNKDGAEELPLDPGTGFPSPLQVQQRELWRDRTMV